MAQVGSWMTPFEASRVLGLSPARVQQLFDAGRLSGERTRLGRLIDPVSVHRLAEERRVAARAAA